MVTTVVLLLMIALATASISFTITTTTIFKWLRDLISPIHPKLHELIHCPWCLGHYIMLGILFVFNDKTLFLDINVVLHYLLNWFALLAIVGVLHHIMLRAYEPIARDELQRQIDLMQKQTEE